MKWLSILVISLIASVAMAQNWKTIASKEAGITFNVPTTPQSSTRTDEGIQTRMWISSSGNSNFVVSVSFRPSNAPANFDKQMADGIKKGFLNSTGATATSDKPATYAGVKGREIVFKNPKGVHGAIWIISRNNKIYTLTVAKQSSAYQAEQKRFFNSIKLSK
jgi:hypothetical protein